MNNPIIEVYKGINIRKYNFLRLRVDQITYKQIIDTEESTGLSVRSILGYSSRPCNHCEPCVIVYVQDKEVKIPRGILYKRIPNGTGTSKGRKIESNAKSY